MQREEAETTGQEGEGKREQKERDRALLDSARQQGYKTIEATMGKATTELKVINESREEAEGSLAKLGAAGDKMKEEVDTKVVELQVRLPAPPSVLTCQAKAQNLLDDTPDTELDTPVDTVSSNVDKLETTTTSLRSSLTVLKTDLKTFEPYPSGHQDQRYLFSSRETRLCHRRQQDRLNHSGHQESDRGRQIGFRSIDQDHKHLWASQGRPRHQGFDRPFEPTPDSPPPPLPQPTIPTLSSKSGSN